MISAKNIFALFLILISVFFIFRSVPAQIVDPSAIGQKREALERDLAKLEEQINGFRSLISGKQSEAASFERDIAILDAQIGKAKLEIKARDIAISQLSEAISDNNGVIDRLLAKINREKASLAELLRRFNEIDQTSLLEAILSSENLSDFFVEFDNLDFLQKAVHDSFAELRQTKETTEEKIDELETRKAEEIELKALQVLEKKRIEEREAEKKNLLKITKGIEAEYQKMLAVRAKDAATIRSQLFLLQGSPDIPFEKAVEYANIAFQATGIRPAFLLGIIAEESNLGANVGTGNWRQDLAHPRCASQRTAFQQITSELGLNPDLMPVSKRTWYGYCGGAMGPAQFMPTTWWNPANGAGYKNIVAKLTCAGRADPCPNPWNFVAAALLLKDNGAVGGNYSAERKAALKYLAGSNWSKPAYAFYGDDVMALAAKYQEQMNIILARR
jgi:peptidoglycan hydrolase CwlO-like protein